MMISNYVLIFFGFMVLSIGLALIGTGILELYHRLSEREYL